MGFVLVTQGSSIGIKSSRALLSSSENTGEQGRHSAQTYSRSWLHVFAFGKPDAFGRHLTSNRSYNSLSKEHAVEVSLRDDSMSRKQYSRLNTFLVLIGIFALLASRFMTPVLGHFVQSDSLLKYQKTPKRQCFERIEVDWAPPTAIFQISLQEVQAHFQSPNVELRSQLNLKAFRCNRAPPLA